MTNKSANAPVAPSDRMRLSRQRRRNGFRLMHVLLHETEIEALSSKGFLENDRRHDQNAVENALGDLIRHSLGEVE